MIRINLLPFRAARAKENIRRQVSIFMLLLVFVLLVLWYTIILVDQKAAALEQDIAHVKQEISLYKAKADRVTEIQKALKILDQKLAVVANLKAMRREPVVLMESMPQLIIPERMWITSLQAANTTVTLKGVAFDNKTVADFMNNIESSPIFSAVDLKSAQLKVMEETKVKEFELICHKTPTAKKDQGAGNKK